MHEGRRGRIQSLTVIAAVTLAAATAGYVAGSFVAGFDVPDPALVVALGASWLCILALALIPPPAGRATAAANAGIDETTGPEAGDEAGREIDAVSGLVRYDAELDARHVCHLVDGSWAVVVIEVDDHVAATAVDLAAADALIADAAERIDAVAGSYGGITRRLNGPQFLVLVGGLEDAALLSLATTLHDGLPLGSIGDASVGRLVVGVAVAEGREDVSALIRAATAALTQAKRLASDVPVYFHDRLVEEARERLSVGRALRVAIDERRIDLAFQPQVDLADGGLLGVEVLARWDHPALGPIAPGRFLKVAADLGLSRQLDRLVFEKAFAQLRAWDDAGVPIPRVCVNVTPETIATERAIGLAGLLSTYAIRPDRVTVEITESRILEGEVGARVVQRYRDLGLRVSLDDFGSGRSSFTQLVTLPVTGVKIDRSLLSDHDVDASVLGAIIQAGTALGLAVSAVGIETDDQRELLERLGCTVGQGYLFSRPLTASELVDWLRTPLLVG